MDRYRDGSNADSIVCIKKKTNDLEYADDTLLMGVTKPQLQSMLESLEDIALEYGMKLNNTKTELLSHPRADHTALSFRDGTIVPNVTTVKYLGPMISWTNPFETSFYHRLGLAEEAYKKLRLIWNSSLSRKEKVKIFEATFTSVLLYGLDSLTLTPKQLHRIDGQYFRFLRRAIGIKASFYSRIPNREVWTQALKPTLPSQTLPYRQYQHFVRVLQQNMEEPTHNVLFGSVFRDRIILKGRRRGMQFPYWLEVYASRCFPGYKPDHTTPHNRYLQIAKLVRSLSFEMAPKRAFTERAWP